MRRSRKEYVGSFIVELFPGTEIWRIPNTPGVYFPEGGKVMKVDSGIVALGSDGDLQLFVHNKPLENLRARDILCIMDDEEKILYLRQSPPGLEIDGIDAA